MTRLKLSPVWKHPVQHAIAERPAPAAPVPAVPSPADVAGDDEPVGAEEALSRLFAEMSEQQQDLGAALLREPASILRMLRLLRRLPKVQVRLPRSGDHREVSRALRDYAASRRMTLGVTAVLDLPRLPGAYTEGHARATVRRKTRAAERGGVTVRRVPPEERGTLVALADEHERTNGLDRYRIADPQNGDLLDYAHWLVACDADGAPIVLSVTPICGEWATLRYFRTLVPGQTSSAARYLLAAELAESLREAGVRRLVDATRPHWLPNGLRHFQRMLGFRLVRLTAPRRA